MSEQNGVTVRGVKEKITLSSLLIGLALSVLGLTIYNVWVRTPEIYAQKCEVQELKRDVMGWMSEISRTQKEILRRLPRSKDD